MIVNLLVYFLVGVGALAALVFLMLTGLCMMTIADDEDPLWARLLGAIGWAALLTLLGSGLMGAHT
jgi:hypothetical protein